MTQPQLGSFESIPLSAIRLSLTNPRKHFDETAMQELTRSVQAVGVNQPVLLRPVKIVLDDVLYELVTGERRYRASVAAEKEGIPAIIRELTDEQALEIQMIENLQRADLHPVEEAEGFRLLLAHGATPEDCARKSGKSLAHVLRIIKLLDLEVLAKQIYAEGHLSLDHALLLARLTAKDQERALCYLMNISEHEIRKDRTAADLIQAKLDRRKPPVPQPDEDEEEGSWEREQYERISKT
ncbi:MAG TPA: ParB/RepB/Spo0J family partition protein, partial [Terriglobus sp.]